MRNFNVNNTIKNIKFIKLILLDNKKYLKLIEVFKMRTEDHFLILL